MIVKKPPALFTAFFLLWVSTSSSAQEPSSCTPLNSTLSICTDVPGIKVSLVDATTSAVLGIVRLKARSDLFYAFNIAWDLTSPLEEYAQSYAEELGAEHRLQEPAFVEVLGRPAIRYDVEPLSSESPNAGLKMVLFIDMGTGIATFLGNAKGPEVTAEDLYLGAGEAARIIRIRQ
ncbi:hypothetical protein [Erythrobacter dokdonensis]|uniref:hypothetical protein n=1 Tax=Erythrobacter dokdonensis TaxID=328225 RepID=UPI00117C66E2|nr:hypothetical protein [Erythrobacter dokdonensis]